MGKKIEKRNGEKTCWAGHVIYRIRSAADPKLLPCKLATSAELLNFFRSPSEPASASSLNYAELSLMNCHLWLKQAREALDCRFWYPLLERWMAASLQPIL